jgi:hypothetical protein
MALPQAPKRFRVASTKGRQQHGIRRLQSNTTVRLVFSMFLVFFGAVAHGVIRIAACHQWMVVARQRLQMLERMAFTVLKNQTATFMHTILSWRVQIKSDVLKTSP